jgi:hypothetical protein
MNWTHGMNKNANKKKGMKPHKAKGPMNISQLHVAHNTHDTSKKHSCYANHNVLV